MASEKPRDSSAEGANPASSSASDIQALAAEVVDLWQDHLSVLATDPQAKAELMQLMEPQRRLFADWAAMMQNGMHATGASPNPGQSQSQPAAASQPVAESAARAEAAADAFDDSALRLAQLAHRTAQLENRVSELERSIATSFTKGGFSKPKSASSSSKISGAREKSTETARGPKSR
jgi:hypothetical protein